MKIIVTILSFLFITSFVNADTIRPDLPLTPDEEAWIDTHPVIRVGSSPDYVPFNFRIDGKPSGYSVELVKLLAERLGVRVEFVPELFSKQVEMIEQQELDLLTSIGDVPERSSFLHVTQPYKATICGIFVRDGETDIRELEDLSGKTVAIASGDAYARALHRLYPDIVLILSDDYLGALEMVAVGTADATVQQVAVGTYLARQNMLSNLKVVGGISASEYQTLGYRIQDYHIGVRKDWPELVTILDKALKEVTREEWQRLDEQWMGFPSETIEVELTSEERVWLKEHPVIRVGSIDNIKPLQFPNESGEIQGVFMDYLNKVSEILGIQFELSENIPWKEAVRRLKTRETDMLPGIMQSPERLKHSIFTEPYLSLPTVIFTRDNGPFVGSLEQLYGKRVATREDLALSRYLDQNYPLLEVIKIDNAGNGLKELASGELDAYVGTIMSVSYTIRETGYTNVKASGAAPFIYEISMGVRRDWPEFVGILQKALDAISESERNAIYGRWVSVTYEHGFDYTILWFVLGGGLIIFVFFLLSNTRLRSAVRKRTHELVESEGKARALLNSPTDSIFLIDLQGIILDMNETALNMLSVSRKKHIGSYIWDLFPQDVVELKNTYIDKVIQMRETIRFEDKRNGIWFDNVVHPILDKDQNVIQIAVIARDITERKKMEETLLQSEKLRSIGTITAGISHDFNNILSVISGKIQLLDMAHQDNKELTEEFRIIMKAVDDGAKISGKMLQSTKTSQDTKEFTSSDLRDMIMQSIDFVKPRWKNEAQARGIDYNICTENMKRVPFIMCNSSEIREIFVNILNNAFDAMPEGGSISFSTWSDDDTIFAGVSDTGDGMSEDVKNNIFLPFFTTKGELGTGLGMSMAYGIVTGHGGKIEVNSEIGKGTKFTLQFPITNERKSQLEASMPKQVTSVKNLHILVVDDEDVLRDILDKLLTRDGHKVKTVDNGAEAIELAREEDFNLILCDLAMPNVYGYEVIKAVHKSSKSPKIGIMTGFGERLKPVDDEEFKVDFIIKKPIKYPELAKHINDLFGMDSR